MISHEQFFALGVLWVGGLGFLFFAYPQLACRLFHREPTPKRLRDVRVMGAVELAVVFAAALLTFVGGFFH